MLFTLSGCYYQPDLRSQTAGSLVGGVGTGALIGEVGGDLITMGTGGVLGSIIVGMAGQTIDNHRPLMQEDPVNTPVNLFYYEVYRAPLVPERFYPAQIVMAP